MIKSIYEPEILDPGIIEDQNRIRSLRSSDYVFVVDRFQSLVLELTKIKNPGLPYRLHSEEIDAIVQERLEAMPVEQQGIWVYYPWNSHLIHVLDEHEFIEVRTNRNKYKITGAEQAALSSKKIGVAGLSVGRSISLTMAMERSFGEIRLADFDSIELSNLNRIQGSLTELGVNKAVAAAREIKQLDPFLEVKVFEQGLTEDNLDQFFDAGGRLDLFVEECDGLDIKISSRVEARRRGIPVFMEASDRCMIDVERFDQEPDRPLLHGLVGDISIDELKRLKSDEEKLPYLTKIVGVETLSTRMRASMLEIEQSITSWPQLAADVNKGGGIGAEVVRNILLGKSSGSGRFYVDTEEIIPLERIELHQKEYSSFKPVEVPAPSDEQIKDLIRKHGRHSGVLPKRDLQKLLEAANAAPSGGNTQPWIWKEQEGQLFVFHDKSLSHSLLDLNTNASKVAIGCSVTNLCLKAEKLGYRVTVSELDESDYPLIASLTHKPSTQEMSKQAKELERWIFARSTNRTFSEPTKGASDKLNKLNELWREESRSVEFNVIEDSGIIEQIAKIVAVVEKERILSPWGYHDYIQEVRWNHSDNERTRDGVYIDSVELSKAEATGLRISRDALVMDEYDEEKRGSAFGRLIAKSTVKSLAVGVISSTDNNAVNWFNVGQELQKVWLMVNACGLDLQPISPITFLNDGLSGSTYQDFPISQKRVDGLKQKISSQSESLSELLRGTMALEGPICYMFRITDSSLKQDISLRREEVNALV